ncbi:CCHC-type domain-containing protein [Citrus sinensis]|nr:CCHC-type domain-containing protein [Citrus sinensis]
MERMKATGEKIAANCLIGKIMLTRGVNREGLKTAMQLAWRTVREVKVESMGDNVFLFKFANEVERRRILKGGPWHFDRALLVLAEPSGIGDIKKQSFTHTSFWVQIHNIPIMCMVRETIKMLGERIGIVEDIEADEAGECLGQFAKVRISVNITQPLKKVVYLQQEGEKIQMPVLYEKLPDFCFCCAHIGHQFKECLNYKGQPKEELPYDAWMRALSQAERVKLNRSRERRNWEQFQKKTGDEEVNTQKSFQFQHDPITANGSLTNKTGTEMGDRDGPMSKNREPAIGDNPLMQCDEVMESLQPSGKSKSEETNQQQSMSADKDGCTRNENERAGSKKWGKIEIAKAKEKIPNKDHAKTNEEKMDNGPKNLQPRVQKMEKGSSSEPKNSKRPSTEISRPSPENKKQRLLSPLKQSSDQNQFSSSSINHQLKLVDEEQVEGEEEAVMGENILARAGSQPR